MRSRTLFLACVGVRVAFAQRIYRSYEPPSSAQLLFLSSFLLLLPAIGALFDKLRARLIGQIVLGTVYGAPLASLLGLDWQMTLLSLGYVGLVLLVFEGGLSTSLPLSVSCATTGIVLPIALSLVFFVHALHHTILHSFIAGASLSATSLGTTIAVLKARSGSLFHSSIATVLMAAALFDDVLGLITAAIVASLTHRPSHLSVGGG